MHWKRATVAYNTGVWWTDVLNRLNQPSVASHCMASSDAGRTTALSMWIDGLHQSSPDLLSCLQRNATKSTTTSLQSCSNRSIKKAAHVGDITHVKYTLIIFCDKVFHYKTTYLYIQVNCKTAADS